MHPSSPSIRELPGSLLDPAYRAQALKVFIRLEPSKGQLVVDFAAGLDPHYEPEYAAQVFGTDLRVHYTVDMDLDAERQALQQCIAAFVKTEVGTHLCGDHPLRKVDRTKLKKELQPLAKQGWSMAKRLFELRDAAESQENIKLLRAAVRSVLSRSQRIVVQSPAPLFPWSFLFGATTFNQDDDTSWEPEDFWGFLHEIELDLPQTARRTKMPAASRIVPVICPEVDQGRHRSPTGIFASAKWIECKFLLRRALSDFRANGLYFLGHGGHGEPLHPSTSHIQIDGEKLTVQDLMVQDDTPTYREKTVLTFLNGCNTAALGAWNESTLPGYLCLRGRERVCCITTVDRVPREFAVRFAEEFWSRFLRESMPVGQALLRARRKMFHEYHSPLGLLYTFFGRVDTCLDPKET